LRFFLTSGAQGNDDKNQTCGVRLNMSTNLSYVLITPYSTAKGRAGGIIARLLSRTDLELAGAQMVSLDGDFASSYADLLRRTADGEKSLLADYVEQNFARGGGLAMFLLFRGENPCEKLLEVCGRLNPAHRTRIDEILGRSIRDAYADFIVDPSDSQKIVYFEPAVITARTSGEASGALKLFLPYLRKFQDAEKNSASVKEKKLQRTLIIIKPDNWNFSSTRPGAILDMFSASGLRIIGVKIHNFSLEEALLFYGPVEQALKSKLAPMFGKKAREVLEREFGLPLTDETEKALCESFGAQYARDQFERIVEFMSGSRPGNPSSKPVKTMIVVYEGEDAVAKIRNILGPTDPSKAPGGTIRREFGSSVMVNAAHASDGDESYEREKNIVKINKNGAADLIEDYLKTS
jgi:nucleoside diphosphate kinase